MVIASTPEAFPRCVLGGLAGAGDWVTWWSRRPGVLQLPLLLPFVPGLVCIGRRQLPVLLLS